MKIVSSEQMRNIEKQANESGLNYEQMMINAGRNLAKTVVDHYGFLEEKIAVGLIGPGNNGGDTLIALQELAKAGWKTIAYLFKERDADDSLLRGLVNAGGEWINAVEDKGFRQLDAILLQTAILLDGVLGMGFRMPLKPDIGKTLQRVKRYVEKNPETLHVVAVDCPSGVDCSSGAASAESLPAEITVCMAAIKEGLLKFPAFELVGELVVVDIGLDPKMPGWSEIQTELADWEMVEAKLPKRRADAHKNTFGKGLIVAGSLNYTGAALLAGKAAYRSGIGWVSMAVPTPLHVALAGHLPEATWFLLPHELGVIAEGAVDVLSKEILKFQAALIGPGIGIEETTTRFFNRLLEGSGSHIKGKIGFSRVTNEVEIPKSVNSLPRLIVDADGLKILARIDLWETKLPARSILTPHAGEMAILTGLPIEEIQAERIRIARMYAQRWGHVIILKGACSVVADPDGRVVVIPVATAALARAGTGDVLAGVVLSFVAQGMDPFDAAVTAAFIHGQAGIVTAQRLGNVASVMAGDVADAISDVLSMI